MAILRKKAMADPEVSPEKYGNEKPSLPIR